MAVAVLAFIAGAWYLADSYLHRGEDLNRTAWESSYRERGVPIPASGPREGYWGARLGGKVPDELLRWREPETHLAGLVDIDAAGRQYYRSPGRVAHRILIIGGSVAFGANASSIATTYFNVLGRELDKKGIGTEIVIVAAGAWKSIQELRALQQALPALKPELVVFLNGLNDLTNGSTSRTLYGEPTETRDGAPWTIVYHAHDYQERVADYLANMRAARELTTEQGAQMLVVLQPSLNERSKRSRIEEKLLALTLEAHSSAAALTASYRAMAQGLDSLSRDGGMGFLDASKAFDGQKETVFSDIWHFTDFGHDLLGKAMADEIAAILTKRSADHTKRTSDAVGRGRGRS